MRQFVDELAVAYLVAQGVELLIALGGHPGVKGYPEDVVDRLGMMLCALFATPAAAAAVPAEDAISPMYIYNDYFTGGTGTMNSMAGSLALYSRMFPRQQRHHCVLWL